MAIFRFKVGDKVVRCKSISQWEMAHINMANVALCPQFHLPYPNGVVGTIVDIKRNKFGRIEHIEVEWNTEDRISSYRMSVDAAIYTLHPIEYCDTCQHRLSRLAKGDCGFTSYKMSNKHFVDKWRKRLHEK